MSKARFDFEHDKNQWEQVRTLTFFTSPYLSKEIKKPSDLIRFSWDKKEEKLNELMDFKPPDWGQLERS